jgi:hypothetical protein
VGEYLIVLAILAAVVVFVSAPLRRAIVGGHSSQGGAGSGSGLVDRAEANVAELEAAREAKYRELRDAELDFRTGKLSDEDYKALDRNLRGEAIEILRGLDHERERAESSDD